MLSVEMKILVCFVWAFIVFFVTALIIGADRKAQWFQKRTKYSWFDRRGIISELLHFGYPKTKEGYGVTGIMVVVIGAVSYLMYIL